MGDGVALWRASRLPASRCRREARMAIVAVVYACSGGTDELPADIFQRVDAAYPFGERKYQPYKEWLRERTLFITAIRPPAMPTADEVAACEVARDLIEDGDPDPAILARLLAQAPNRLARKCPACGGTPGKPCTELVPADPSDQATAGAPVANAHAARLANVARAWASLSHIRVPLVIPHHARLVGHLDAGPLLTSRSA